ncbi:flagellar filament capping protein FliD [Pseudoalteromonas sp. SWXJZ10B]|uniref:flagellar filament capping protein FliD n=1 Tax=Pseudoalteromonas sp. SWXJZ10B TaxID=2792063 RepID=UPI0018CF014B|nr:flagellar filament capping protein FliD [Pseudoalteromonas sp. SWXJZ10B]MBH0042947.1 flagellar filament capping protein FliD [Pseudoalteromonas sp. SWXJZ10B]
MSITFNGLGSGLAVADIVDALVAAEQAPAESRLTKTESALTTDISAIGALKLALEKVQESMAKLGDSDEYQQRTVSGSDDNIQITADEDAQPGGYSINVNNLATEHKILSEAFEEDSAIGEGTLTLTSGDDTFDIEVSDEATLADIRDAINDSSSNSSINATIITDDEGQHLVLAAKNSGIENKITVAVSDIDGEHTDMNGLSALAFDAEGVQNSTEIIEAKDASITIDGTLTVSSSTNKFENVIDGITLTAKKVHDEDDDISDVSVTENNNNIQSGLNSFISSYNELLELSKDLGTSSDGSAGVMSGDSLLRGVMSKLRSTITGSVELSGGSSLSLAQLGVSTDRYGVLSLDTDTLNEKIDDNIDSVEEFFVGNKDEDGDGFASTFDEFLSYYTDSDGIIENRIDTRKNQLEDVDDQRESLAAKMESLSARLYSQYNAMDLLVASLNNTSTYVQAQLENMPGVVRQSN